MTRLCGPEPDARNALSCFHSPPPGFGDAPGCFRSPDCCLLDVPVHAPLLGHGRAALETGAPLHLLDGFFRALALRWLPP